MSYIHRTTLTPTKLELLTSWLPAQPWYLGGGTPELVKSGGFRLDDPEGEVGVEFMVTTDTSGDQPVAYHVPFTYRAAPLDAADDGLIGTTEHGVLGKRWVYDGTHDPVLVAELMAFMAGEAESQMQSVSDTPDPSVTGWSAEPGARVAVDSMTVTHGSDGTDVLVRTSPGDRQLTLHVHRVLHPGQDTAGPDSLSHVTAGWPLSDGTTTRAVFTIARTCS
jgi:hypothetical protein